MSVVQILVEENTPISKLGNELPDCPACAVNKGTVPITIGRVEYLVCAVCVARRLA